MCLSLSYASTSARPSVHRTDLFVATTCLLWTRTQTTTSCYVEKHLLRSIHSVRTAAGFMTAKATILLSDSRGDKAVHLLYNDHTHTGSIHGETPAHINTKSRPNAICTERSSPSRDCACSAVLPRDRIATRWRRARAAPHGISRDAKRTPNRARHVALGYTACSFLQIDLRHGQVLRHPVGVDGERLAGRAGRSEAGALALVTAWTTLLLADLVHGEGPRH